MTEILLSDNTSNHFKFIMTQTRGKTCDLRRRNGALTPPSRKPRTVTCSCNLCQLSLTCGLVTGDSKGAKCATSGVNIQYLRHLLTRDCILSLVKLYL